MCHGRTRSHTFVMRILKGLSPWARGQSRLFTAPPAFVCTDRKMAATHLPLAWTHSSALEEQKLLSLLEDLAKTFQPN